MSEISVEELAGILEKDNQWLADHYDDLIQKYPGKTVAIENGEVVAVGNDYGDVYRPFLKEKRLVMPLVVEVPHPDDRHDGVLLSFR
ncbi:hypothetical protein H6S82_09125 [Planktothrix sp. FACHB-1355]|nr:hypothetical protein [Planktothrix sp. FACHB-1355]